MNRDKWLPSGRATEGEIKIIKDATDKSGLSFTDFVVKMAKFYLWVMKYFGGKNGI